MEPIKMSDIMWAVKSLLLEENCSSSEITVRRLEKSQSVKRILHGDSVSKKKTTQPFNKGLSKK
jgi:hypothetical protein